MKRRKGKEPNMARRNNDVEEKRAGRLSRIIATHSPTQRRVQAISQM